MTTKQYLKEMLHNLPYDLMSFLSNKYLFLSVNRNFADFCLINLIL